MPQVEYLLQFNFFFFFSFKDCLSDTQLSITQTILEKHLGAEETCLRGCEHCQR